MEILFLDTETGGLDPQKHALLQIGGVLWEDGRIMREFEFNIPNIQDREWTEEALEVNGIDLANFKTSDAGFAIDTLIDIAEHCYEPKQKCVVAGHNVGFDIGFLKVFFDDMGYKWDDHFSHRVLDTAGILNFLMVAGRYQAKSASLDAALEYYKIPLDQGERHGALADAKYTAILFDRLLSEVSR